MSSKITREGIVGNTLSESQFDSLRYLDSRMYLESAMCRFEDWDSSFDNSHVDWKARIKVQNDLANCLNNALNKRKRQYAESDKIKVIFLGASLGSVASYCVFKTLKKHNILRHIDLYIYDLLEEPLLRTKNGDFAIPDQAVYDLGGSRLISIEQYKNILRKATIKTGNIVKLPDEYNDTFDIVVAPYIHHHLNLFDKEVACKQMCNIANKTALLLVGDLTFSHHDFNRWLLKHATESVPYAIESFISLEEHISFFSGYQTLDKSKHDFYYVFCLGKQE